MKKRYKKTLLEKYSNDNKSDEAKDFIISNNKKMDEEEIFQSLPYIGIFYIPVEYHELYQEYENADMTINGKNFLKAKMVNITSTKFEYYSHDSHHHHIIHGNKNVDDYYMEGNIIHKP